MTTKPKTERKRLDRCRKDLFDVPEGIWASNDNGQIACDQCVPYYGRIAWRRMSGVEVLEFRKSVADCIAPTEPTCERCRGQQRRAAEQAVAEPLLALRRVLARDAADE
jgi:hypothetical protein